MPAEETKGSTDPESARFRLFDAVATLLKNVARVSPLLILVDGLHDADQPSLQMLRFIARAAKDVSLLLEPPIGTPKLNGRQSWENWSAICSAKAELSRSGD